MRRNMPPDTPTPPFALCTLAARRVITLVYSSFHTFYSYAVRYSVSLEILWLMHQIHQRPAGRTAAWRSIFPKSVPILNFDRRS